MNQFLKILRPLLLINGVSAMRLRFDTAVSCLIVDGIQGGQTFQRAIPFGEIEAAFTLQPDKLPVGRPQVELTDNRQS